MNGVVALQQAQISAAKKYGTIYGQRRHDLLLPADTQRVMTSPPTVAVAGPFTARTSLITSNTYISLATLLGGGYFNFVGATPTGSSVLANTSQGVDAPPYQIDFYLFGSQIEFWANWASTGSSFRLKVDGHYVSLNPTMLVPAVNLSNYSRVYVNFGTYAVRRITIEADRLALIGFYREANGMVWPTHSRPDKVAFLGDSFAAGSVAQSAVLAWPFHAARLLRWGHPWLLGQGGTGYLNPGTSGRTAFAGRVADVANAAPDILVVSGGFNDVPSKNAAYTASALQAAASALFAAIATSCPTVKKVYVVGAWQPTGSPAAELTAANNAVKAAALAAPNVTAFIDTTGWVTGSGWAGVAVPQVVAAPTVAATGGTFTAGTYYYAVTAKTSRGDTKPSAEVSATVAANGTVTLYWAPVTFATGYDVYRGTTPGGENVKVSANQSTTNFVDTGSAGAGASLPTADTSGNLNGSGSAEIVTASDGTHPVDAGHEYYGTRIAVGIAGGLAA